LLYSLSMQGSPNEKGTSKRGLQEWQKGFMPIIGFMYACGCYTFYNFLDLASSVIKIKFPYCKDDLYPKKEDWWHAFESFPILNLFFGDFRLTSVANLRKCEFLWFHWFPYWIDCESNKFGYNLHAGCMTDGTWFFDKFWSIARLIIIWVIIVHVYVSVTRVLYQLKSLQKNHLNQHASEKLFKLRRMSVVTAALKIQQKLRNRYPTSPPASPPGGPPLLDQYSYGSGVGKRSVGSPQAGSYSSTLRSKLLKLRGLLQEGLISETVWNQKCAELMDSI